MSAAIQLASFPNVSPEDTISLEITRLAKGEHVELVLETGADVVWWKGIEAKSAWGAPLALVQTAPGDPHGPVLATIAAGSLAGSRLVLSKAKFLGIQTEMYELHDLRAFAGRRLRFIWQRDDHRGGAVAGFLRDLGAAVSQAAQGAADLVEVTTNALAEIASDVLETVGTWVRNTVDTVGSQAGATTVFERVSRGAVHWAGTVASAAFDLAGTLLKAGLNGAGGVTSGFIRVVGGAVAGDWPLANRGVGDVSSSVVAPIILVGGKAVAALQALVGLQFGERGLTEAESDAIRRVYRGSIALYNVRIVRGFAGFFNTDFPFVLGNTIYMVREDPATHLDTLIHEVAHVWQYQNEGARYITNAIWAHAKVPDVYSWESEVDAGVTRWQDLNGEAQAAFLEDVWNRGKRRGVSKGGGGVFYKDAPIGDDVEFAGRVDRTSLAIEAVAYVRAALPSRPSAEP